METYQLFQQLSISICEIENAYQTWAESEGISVCSLKIYYTLITSGTMTQKQFCEAFNIPKTSVNKVITELKNNGSIFLETNPEDKRSKLITLTEEGKTCALSSLQPLFEIEETVKKKFGEKQLSELIELLDGFSEMLKNEMKPLKKTLF